jgi:hypothetical protein
VPEVTGYVRVKGRSVAMLVACRLNREEFFREFDRVVRDADVDERVDDEVRTAVHRARN